MVLTPVKAIRAKCLDCCCGHPSEVRLCTTEKCPLHPYRMGKRPKAGGDTREGSNSADAQESSHIFAEETKKERPLV